MDVSSLEKMARFSRSMMIDFLKKNFDKTLPNPTDNEIVGRAKSRFASIIKHIFEGEYLYFLNPLTKSDEKPDLSKLATKNADEIIAALTEPREKLLKVLEPYADKINQTIDGQEMTPALAYFWLIDHDAYHYGQMELLVETIEKGNLQKDIVFEEEVP